MRPAVTAWVALGANLGDARTRVRDALTALEQQPGISALQASKLYRTAPHQAQGPDYINAVVRIQTTLTAPALLDLLQAMEHRAGRNRPYHNAPRTLDLDLLFYGDAIMFSPRLIVPHPRWSERAFVLHPLADVSPEKVSAALMAAVADQPIEPLP